MDPVLVLYSVEPYTYNEGTDYVVERRVIFQPATRKQMPLAVLDRNWEYPSFPCETTANRYATQLQLDEAGKEPEFLPAEFSWAC